MKSNLSRSKPVGAFTALELLAVIVVMAFMGLIMVPALAKTNPNTKALLCLNNHRQLGRAFMMYTQDNHEFFPPNPDDGTTTPGYVWSAGQGGVGGADEFDPDLLSDPRTTLLVPYTGKNVALFNCPADPRLGRYDGAARYPNSPLIGQTIRAARSVSMSQAVGTVDPAYAGGGGHRGIPNLPTNGPWLTGNYGQNNNTTGPFATFGKSSSFKGIRPDNVFLIADEAPLSINDAGMATCADVNNRRFIDYPSSLHNRGCVF